MDGIASASLSPQEAVLYPSLFKMALGPKAILTETTIPASTAAGFLKRSGLNKKQLHDIWSLSDPLDHGFLTAEGFYKACRLVGHAQCGASSLTTDLICQEPPSLPFFEGSDGEPDSVWKPSEAEIKLLTDLYRKEGGTNKMDGSDARAVLLRSGLSNSELCDIWDLADTDRDGKLSFGEFIVAMVLVSRVRDQKAFIPPQLPQPLKDIVNISPGESIPPSASNASKPNPEPVIGFGAERPPTSPILREASSYTSPKVPMRTEPTLMEKELASEHKGLSESISRGRQFRKQVLEGRARLAELKEQAKKVEIELVTADHEAQRVGDQILSLKQQIAEGEDELESFRRESGQVALSAGGSGNDILQAVAAIRESIGEEEREVLEVRAQIERVQREKIDLQSSLGVLQEKKRQADQDRNLMIVGLENERSKLVSVRAERLKLWEQRHQLTRELTTKTFDQLNPYAANSGLILPSSAALHSPQRNAVRDRKGVRADSPSQQANPTWSKGETWSTFGAGGDPFVDPVAGAFSTQSKMDSSPPQFGSI